MSAKRRLVRPVDREPPAQETSEGMSDDAVQEFVDVARLYYEEELSQQQIALRLGKSRPTGSSMLKTSRTQGIVTIDIRAPSNRSRSLELTLAERFGLHAVRVLTVPKGGLDST